MIIVEGCDLEKLNRWFNLLCGSVSETCGVGVDWFSIDIDMQRGGGIITECYLLFSGFHPPLLEIPAAETGQKHEHEPDRRNQKHV